MPIVPDLNIVRPIGWITSPPYIVESIIVNESVKLPSTGRTRGSTSPNSDVKLGGDGVEVVIIDPEAPDTAPISHPINLNERTGSPRIRGKLEPRDARGGVPISNVSHDGRGLLAEHY
jgi:hypothetical protein